MANVAHKDLTGSDLHEPKGIGTATNGQVYIANGSGSGSWTTINAVDNFSTKYLIASDVKSAGTNGGSYSSGAPVTRTLNTITNNISGASLSSNTISLPAGTYYIQASVPGFNTGNIKSWLKNTSDNTTALTGTSEWSTNGTGTQVRSHIVGVVAIGAPKNFQVLYQSSGSDTLGLGVSSNLSGLSEVYTIIQVWKIV